MKKLVIMRGLPGSGKSTWIKENGYEIYTICPDSLRLMFAAPNPGISQDYNRRVWELIFEMLEERMKNGSLTVIDATHITWKSIKAYLDLCEKYQYLLEIKDFSNVSACTCMSRNELREEYKKVPNEIILKMDDKLKTADNTKINKFI